MHDLRRGFRNLRTHLAVTAITGFCLGLGVGATSAVFTFLYHVVLEPLPYEQPDRLIKVWQFQLETPLSLSPLDFLDIERQTRTFESLAAYASQNVSLVGADEPSFVTACAVSPRFFSTLRVRAARGRVFSAGDYRNRDDVVLVSDRFWKNRLGSGNILETKVLLDEKLFTVVGILPQGFSYPEATDLWFPLVFTQEELLNRAIYYLESIGRLRQDVSLAETRQELKLIGRRLALQYPDTNTEIRFDLTSLKEELVGNARISFYVLFGASSLVFLMSCANVSSLLLARNAARSSEIVLRSALGASPTRLMRQVVVENFPLATLGGISGLLFAQWSFSVVRAWSPANIPRLHQVASSTILLAVLVFTLVAIVICNLLPAVHAAYRGRRPLRQTNAGRGFEALNGIVLAEVALALILSTGATLLAKSYVLLHSMDLGFDPTNVLAVRLRLPSTKYSAEPAKRLFLEEVLRKIRSLPDVAAVGAANRLPVGARASTMVRLEGSSLAPERALPMLWSGVGGDYLRALRIPLLAGETLAPISDDRPEVLVNQRMAELYWPGQQAIGKIVHFGASESPWHEVVGVVANVRQGILRQDAEPEFYAPLGNSTLLFLIVRAETNADQLAPSVKATLWEVDPNLPLSIEAMEDRLARQVAGPRFYSLVFGVYAGIALAMALSGAYGVVSYSVAQHYRAYGVRTALGATQRDLFKAVFASALRPIIAGLAIGFGIALLAAGFLTTLLRQVSPRDPLIFLPVILGLALASSVATYWPARRASQVEPAKALREL